MSVSTRPTGSAGPKRPIFHGETRRDGILEAALAAMSRKAFERASIAAIAGRADILVALAERVMRRIIETVAVLTGARSCSVPSSTGICSPGPPGPRGPGEGGVSTILGGRR
jgi:hypothetical protein